MQPCAYFVVTESFLCNISLFLGGEHAQCPCGPVELCVDRVQIDRLIRQIDLTVVFLALINALSLTC